MTQQDDARAWNKLNSAFREKIDWRYLEYIAVKEFGKEVQIARFG